MTDWLAAALTDARVRARYYAHILSEPTPAGCLIWTGAVSGAGHGRFWIGSQDGNDRVIIAHRFGYALAHGAGGLTQAIQHQCDEPLCQNPNHLVAGTIAQNTRAWARQHARCSDPAPSCAGRRRSAPDP